MKRIVLLSILIIGTITCQAQEIKPQQVTADDYIRLFEEMGYKVFSYDISEFENIKSYQPVIMHYTQGEKEGENILPFDWEVYDEIINNVKVTVSPAEKGKKAGIYFNETMGISFTLIFQEQISPDGETSNSIGVRSFKLDGSKINDFYPLVLLGSYWYDADAGMFRFCGETELSSDLTEDFIANIPEYYILGIRLVE